MKEPFDLERYLTAGVENIVKGAMKISLKNPVYGPLFDGQQEGSRTAPQCGGAGRAYTALSDCQRHDGVQPSLCGLLRESEPCLPGYRGRGSDE